jgi:hypothetical protein
MKVFISWSGERSKLVAELLDDWIQCVIQAVDPWMSSKDIDRGALWFTEISDQLANTTVGIVCLTKENKNKPWILFESGALAKGLSSNRVCTFLIDLAPTDLENPLAQFNHTFPTRDSLWELVRTINITAKENSLKESILARVYDTYWPQFEESFAKIIDSTPEATAAPKRKNDDIMLDVLSTVRMLDRRLRSIESNSERNPIRFEKELIKSKNMTSEDVRNNIWNLVKQEVPDEVIMSFILEESDAPRSFVRREIEKAKVMNSGKEEKE